MRARLGRIAAWVVTATALGWLFWKTPVSDVWSALSHAAPWTLPAVLVATALVYVADAFAMWKTFGWFLAKLPFRDILVVRGATYLLAVINYSLGQGAIVYFIHRARGAPVVRGLATVLLIMGTNLLALLLVVTVGLSLSGTHPAGLAPVVGLLWTGLAVYATLMTARPRWLASRLVFDVLLSAGLGGHLRAMLVRLPHVAALMAVELAALRGFGVALPWGVALGAMPVVLLVSALPISVQGLGTTQAAMVLFFSSHVRPTAGDPHAVVLGASLTSQTVTLLFQVATGFICLRSQTARGLSDIRSVTRQL
jgi:uncharacterized membrane protein YbhN (UPF0104 family)